MEPRESSTKARSYGGASRGACISQNTPGTGPRSRPQNQERVKLAPLGISQSEEPQQHRRSEEFSTGRRRRENQASDTGLGSLSSDSSPIKQNVLPIQRHSGISQVNYSKNSVL